MKNLRITQVLAVALAVFTLNCRTSLAGYIGIQGGIGTSDLTPPNGYSTDSIEGWALGLAFDVPLGSQFSVAPEAIFVRRGADLSAGAGVISSRYTVLEVPVYAKLGFGGKVRPVVFAGPNMAWMLSQSLEVQPGASLGGLTLDSKSFDLGLSLGAGIEAGPFVASLRYQLGLLDVDENSASWQARGFLLMVGLKL